MGGTPGVRHYLILSNAQEGVNPEVLSYLLNRVQKDPSCKPTE